MSCELTFEHLKYSYEKAVDYGYDICTLKEYFDGKKSGKILLNRIDVDESIENVINLLDIESNNFKKLPK